MEPNGGVNFRHRRSPSSDRFLDVFSPPKFDAAAAGTSVAVACDELNEDDVFWTGEFTEPNRRSNSPSAGGSPNHHRPIFRQSEKFGILAALPEDNEKLNRPVLCRKPSISSSSATSSSRMVPAIPKPPQYLQEREYSQSMPSRKFHQSAPMNVPVMPRKVRDSELAEVDVDDGEDDEMLPPHEIVARGSTRSPKTTFSVLEGVGRTLKGRDLRQVRNAVWRRTGFID
uniref:Senescence regulator n=1 Tax=Davidia involucrata TaxID=16924 RepID=A0A5B7B5X7_DAVIN